MKRVYIAGALNSDAAGYISNLHRMVDYAIKVKKLGAGVFTPGLDFLLGFFDGEFGYEDYFENNIPWIEVAHCLFVVPESENSEGVKKEKEIARFLGIPIFEDIEELKEFLNE